MAAEGSRTEGKGLEVIDIGVDVPTESFLDAAREHNAKLICYTPDAASAAEAALKFCEEMA